MGGFVPTVAECGCRARGSDVFAPCVAHSKSLWDLHKEFAGIDPATALPTTLDAHRDHQDGLTHCAACGSVYFTATVILTAAGGPSSMLTPQTCVGCGELRKANWP